MRRVVSVVVVIVLLLSIAVPASASVTPRYSYTNSVYARLSIDNFWGVATCEGEIIAYDDVPIDITIYLQVYKDGEWQTVKSWYASDMMSAYLCKSYAIYRGYEYRTYVEGYVYNSSGSLVEIVDCAHSMWYN